MYSQCTANSIKVVPEGQNSKPQNLVIHIFESLCIQLPLTTHFSFARKSGFWFINSRAFHPFFIPLAKQLKSRLNSNWNSQNLFDFASINAKGICGSNILEHSIGIGNSIGMININIAYIKLAKQSNGGNNMYA